MKMQSLGILNFHYFSFGFNDFFYFLISLQVIVLMIGTNNHDHTAEQVSLGIMEIVTTIIKKQPQANLLVMVRLMDSYFIAFQLTILHFIVM